MQIYKNLITHFFNLEQEIIIKNLLLATFSVKHPNVN